MKKIITVFEMLLLIIILFFLNLWYEKNRAVSCFEKIESQYSNEIYAENIDIYYNSNGILSQNEKKFLDLINEERIKNNISKLEIDDDLQNVARLKALDMAENNYFSHYSPTYGSMQNMLNDYKISYKVVSENIAKASCIDSAINMFCSSESHMNNILNSEFNYTGIAIGKTYTGSKIYVEIFISK